MKKTKNNAKKKTKQESCWMLRMAKFIKIAHADWQLRWKLKTTKIIMKLTKVIGKTTYHIFGQIFFVCLHKLCWVNLEECFTDLYNCVELINFGAQIYLMIFLLKNKDLCGLGCAHVLYDNCWFLFVCCYCSIVPLRYFGHFYIFCCPWGFKMCFVCLLLL